LEAHDVQVVVLKQFSEFSQQLDAAIVAGLRQRFGGQQVFHSAGHDEGFVVMWRL